MYDIIYFYVRNRSQGGDFSARRFARGTSRLKALKALKRLSALQLLHQGLQLSGRPLRGLAVPFDLFKALVRRRLEAAPQRSCKAKRVGSRRSSKIFSILDGF